MFDISKEERRCSFSLSHSVDESLFDCHRRKVDTLYASTFGDNAYGWPCSELSFIENCENASMKRSLNDALVSVPVVGSPSSMSTQDVLDSWRSRYAQSPTELERYIKVDVPTSAATGVEDSDGKKVLVSSVSDSTVSD